MGNSKRNHSGVMEQELLIKKCPSSNLERAKEKANMRACPFLSASLPLVLGLLAFISGCKYNVSAPMYDQPTPYKVAPAITSVQPPGSAVAGVNTIAIHGHNFVIASSDTLTPGNTIVYFNHTLQASIFSIDSTSIVVYRPNLTGDSCTITVAPHNTMGEATVSPYAITQVTWQYGGLLQNTPLEGIAVDDQDHVFVAENSTTPVVHEATSLTDNSVIGTLSGVGPSPWGACLGPDGNLYVMSGLTSRLISKIIISSDSVIQKWVQLPAGKVTRFGDIDAGGFLFAGGFRTDLVIIPTYLSGQLTASQVKSVGSYSSDSIFAVKVHNGYVYVASKSVASSSTAKIWRHQLTSDSTLGSQELVLDMNTTAFASERISGIAFSSSGDMYISTNSADPLLVDPGASSDGTKVIDFYKGILPSNCSGIAWGKSSHYLYMITGDGTSANQWTVYRVDMGENGGQ